jgi:hypothetical protein
MSYRSGLSAGGISPAVLSTVVFIMALIWIVLAPR